MKKKGKLTKRMNERYCLVRSDLKFKFDLKSFILNGCREMSLSLIVQRI